MRGLYIRLTDIIVDYSEYFQGISGCGNSNIDNLTIEQNDSEIQDGISYEEYSGYWSYKGKTQEQILAKGGIDLSCMITGDNQFSGTLFVQQEIAQRFASIENISGEIEQAELYFDYSDDEWGNSGTLHIQFLNDSVFVEVLNYKEAENVREVRDISNLIEPLFETDKKYYTEEEFEKEPMLVIHLAKNEIYARHGYIFENPDLYNYFMGCIWYSK